VEVQLRRSDRPRRILVVGAGPAGLKAAEAAARRGHLVTVADVCEEPGGRLRYVRRLGRAAELARSIDWLVDELHDLGVTLELGRRVELADLAGADATVLATGARTDESRLCPTDETVPLFTTTGLLDRIDELDLDGRPVLVVDTVGSQEVALTAEALAERGARLTVATPGLSPGWAVGFTLLKDVLQRIHDLGGRFETSTVVTGIEHGEVSTRHSYARTTQRRPFDLVLAGIAPVADRSLLDAALRHGHHVHPAGDAVAPRTAMHAFREGQDVGAAL
jgi:NADPH-dependent 2,4-dienoyl-CoA reductase/sulfur reductase-like enzyme